MTTSTTTPDTELLAAAKEVLNGLNARIDAAFEAGEPVPVFAGIAALHDAISSASSAKAVDGENSARAVPRLSDGEAKFTPGPWKVDTGMNGRAYGISYRAEDRNHHPVICWRGIARPQSPEGAANARLITAAPALYEALKAVVSVADRKTVEFDMARAALAQARGEA